MRAVFNFGGPAAEERKAAVRGYMDAGSGTQKKKKPTFAVPKIAAKPKSKPKQTVVKKKPAVKKPAAKTSLFAMKPKPLVKKPAAAKKSLFAIKPKPLVKKPVAAKKSLFATKPKPLVKKSVLAKKRNAQRKPMMTNKSKTNPFARKQVQRPARRSASSRSLEETADLGYYAIIAGSFLLSVAILPGVADVALETIGVAYTLYFTYNYLAFEESREKFKNTLENIESGTGIDIPSIFDSTIGAATDVVSKVQSANKPRAYPKKEPAPTPVAAPTPTVDTELSQDDSFSQE